MKKYTKEQFKEIDFDLRCLIFESLLTDDYFNGQQEIGFYMEVGSDGNLLPTPSEIKIIEDEKFNKLLDKLTDKLFDAQEEIELDIYSF